MVVDGARGKTVYATKCAWGPHRLARARVGVDGV